MAKLYVDKMPPSVPAKVQKFRKEVEKKATAMVDRMTAVTAELEVRSG